MTASEDGETVNEPQINISVHVSEAMKDITGLLLSIPGIFSHSREFQLLASHTDRLI